MQNKPHKESHNEHALLLRALSALLAYPDSELRAALPEITEVIRDTRALKKPQKAELIVLADEIANSDPLEAEGRYVDLFDRGRKTSLNIFEHVHGDGRLRGDAMLNLRDRYNRLGLEQSDYELPDHIPVLLEYLSCCDTAETPVLLGECAHVFRQLGNALLQRQSRYASVPAALLALANKEGLDPAAPVMPDEDIDSSWEERPAFEPPRRTMPCANSQ